MSDENNVIPLANRRALKKVKNDPVNQAAKHRPAPVVAAQVVSQRKCLVCTRPTGKPHTRYCPEHTGAYWRWLECAEPGCEVVGERRIPGQTFYRCPSHRDGRSMGTGGESNRGSGQGREQVRLLLAQRRAVLARERERKPLPPRPPNNIGHYI